LFDDIEYNLPPLKEDHMKYETEPEPTPDDEPAPEPQPEDAE